MGRRETEGLRLSYQAAGGSAKETVSMVLVSGCHWATSREQGKGEGRAGAGKQGTLLSGGVSFGDRPRLQMPSASLFFPAGQLKNAIPLVRNGPPQPLVSQGRL